MKPPVLTSLSFASSSTLWCSVSCCNKSNRSFPKMLLFFCSIKKVKRRITVGSQWKLHMRQTQTSLSRSHQIDNQPVFLKQPWSAPKLSPRLPIAIPLRVLQSLHGECEHGCLTNASSCSFKKFVACNNVNMPNCQFNNMHQRNNFLMRIVLWTSWCVWALPSFAGWRFELQHSASCVPMSTTVAFCAFFIMLVWKGDLAVQESVAGIMMNCFNLIPSTIYKSHFMSCTNIVSFVTNLVTSDTVRVIKFVKTNLMRLPFLFNNKIHDACNHDKPVCRMHLICLCSPFNHHIKNCVILRFWSADSWNWKLHLKLWIRGHASHFLGMPLRLVKWIW